VHFGASSSWIAQSENKTIRFSTTSQELLKTDTTQTIGEVKEGKEKGLSFFLFELKERILPPIVAMSGHVKGQSRLLTFCSVSQPAPHLSHSHTLITYFHSL
jgi:hypothetical protein